MSKVEIYKSRPTIEGAGVRLNRAFGFGEAPSLDPFLLLDDFHSDNPDDYGAGFPWHPHRGIETVTYMIHGNVRHEDSMGNNGVIGPGDVQWMTAGSGIIHSEMPEQKEGLMRGLQLWVNLPAKSKMMPPRYQEIKGPDIPGISLEKGVEVKVICGKIGDTEGPVKDLMAQTEYLDVAVREGKLFEHQVNIGNVVFAYVLEGNGTVGKDVETNVNNGHLVVFNDISEISFKASSDVLRFLLISGKPLGEPVAWQGPIVMNTDDELRTAFQEYQDGTFIKEETA